MSTVSVEQRGISPCASPTTAVFSLARRRVMALALSAVLVGQLFGLPYSAEPAYADAPWSTPAILSTGAGNAAGPQVLATPVGDFVAVWTRTDGPNSVVEVSRLERGESVWGGPVAVSGPNQQASAPQISVASTGDLVVAWTRPEGAHSIVEASRLVSGESVWSSPAVLSDINLDASAPQVSAVSAGDFIVVWTLSNGAVDVVQARRLVSGDNSWSLPAVSISGDQQDMSAPQIAADSAGNAVVTWGRENGVAFNNAPNHANSPKRIEASSSVDGGATWGSPATLVSNTRNARNTRIATGAAANFYVIWEQYDGTKWRAITTTTSDTGSSWARPTFALSDMSVIASVPVIVADTQGNVTTAWQRKADYPNNQWLIQSRSRGASASTWSSSATWTSVQALAVPGWHSAQPQLTVDRAGNVTAVWKRINGTHRIIQSSVSTNAGVTWTSARDISLPGSDTDDPQLAASPDGMVAAVWVTTSVTASGEVRTVQSSISRENDSSSTVTFDANSGSGSMADQSGASAAPFASNAFRRTGFTFAGWATAADGSGTRYADGDSYDFSANLTLYAQWTAVFASPPASGGSGESGSVAVQSDPAPVRGGVVPSRRAQAVPGVASPAVIGRPQQNSGSSQPAEAVALVGGKEVVVTAEAQGSQAASYGVGKVTVDVGVAAKDGAVDSVGGVPSLKIASNAPASLKGSGLQPNSTMQVFLPASDGSFIELPSVAVAADGSFDGSLTLGSSNRAKPMPIGKRFIQMVGLDEDGNEMVLDIPVTIAQPLPAPEINRVSGQRPALTPGQALAFNAGAPETVTLKRSSEATSVEGEDWAFTVAGTATDATGQTLAFTRDAPATFSGEGFMPGTRADVWLFSDPILVGTVDIAADGTFSTNFAVDSNFVPTGNHTLQLQGVGTDGFVRAANLGVVVNDTASTPVVLAVENPFGLAPMMFIGASVGGLLLLTGVVFARRRRQRSAGRLAPVS